MLHTLSIVLGYLSLCFWLFAQIPQVIENYRNHSVDGIAPGFLASWIAGDVSNLIGCILTEALPFQVLLSSYYCCIDLMLTAQYVYYTKVYPQIKHRFVLNQRMAPMDAEDDQPQQSLPQEHILLPPSAPIAVPKKGLGQLIPTALFLNMVTGLFLASFGKVRAASSGHELVLENSQSIGVFFAWLCTCLYLVARIPQLYKNHTRKLTEGLSVLLFFCALNGNFFYTLLILTSDEFVHGNGKYVFFIKELPYILGSAGTIVFDLVALYQWRIYRPSGPEYTGLETAVTTGVETYPEGLVSRHMEFLDHGFLKSLRRSNSSLSLVNVNGESVSVRGRAIQGLKGILDYGKDYGSTGDGAPKPIEETSVWDSGAGSPFTQGRGSVGTPLTPWDLLDFDKLGV